MATIHLPPDFKEFLKSLNSKRVEYLVVGGYAVNYYGYSRGTVDIDFWVSTKPDNATKVAAALEEFWGGQLAGATSALFQKKNKVVRMGAPPLRIKVITSVSGVQFDECYSDRVEDTLDGVTAKIISLKHLRANKKASGRLKDLVDMKSLPKKTR